MSSYVLSCCSVVDLSPEYMAERNISFAPLHYILDGKEYDDDMGATMSAAEFYQTMRDGADVSTSQVNVDEFTHYFEPFLANGQDVIHLALSSGLSGSYNSARIAAELLSEKYPDRKLYVIDSLAASAGDGLLLDGMADRRDAGDSIDELYQWTEKNKMYMHHWFTASDLTWFIKGGRVTKAAGWVGTVLKICPVLNVDYMGRLIPRFKIRGKQNALKELVNQMKEHAQDVAQAIMRGNYAQLGALVGKTWQQNQLLDSGTNPSEVQAIIEKVKDLCLGLKLPGAGGGGFLYMMAKDPMAALRIREILTKERPNDRARFVEMSVSRTGMQVSRS